MNLKKKNLLSRTTQKKIFYLRVWDKFNHRIQSDIIVAVTKKSERVINDLINPHIKSRL